MTLHEHSEAKFFNITTRTTKHLISVILISTLFLFYSCLTDFKF